MAPAGPRLIVLTGPTAVGKSAWALELAERFGFEIVGADSRQVYRQLSIGTAKPSPADRRRIPHHLIDYVELDEPYAVARYREDGDRVLADLAAPSVGAIVVGGTGHYIQALVDRIEPPPVAPRPDFRSELEALAAERGPAAVYERLVAADPVAADFIGPSNVRRMIRALEVAHATGRPFSELGRRRSEPRPALRLAMTLPRPELYRRADDRVDEMMMAGWLDEVQGLLARGYDPALPALSSTGYRELIAHLQGRLSLDDAVQRAKWETHAYIRRQVTWLRRQQGYEWIEADPAGYARAATLIERHLTEPAASISLD